MLDTNMCSFILRKDEAPSLQLKQRGARHRVVLSSVAYFELRKGALAPGAPKRLSPAIDALVERLNGVLPWDADSAQAAARIHTDLAANGRSIGGFDTLIAGHAVAAKAVLVTNNTREFERVAGLKIEDWS